MKKTIKLVSEQNYEVELLENTDGTVQVRSMAFDEEYFSHKFTNVNDALAIFDKELDRLSSKYQ